jgi:hypothetical protein
MPADHFLQDDVEIKRNTDRFKLGVAFQQTLMPEQPVNFIKPRKHDFL